MADVNVLDLTQATPGTDDSLILFDRNTGEAKSTRYNTLKDTVLSSKFGDSSPAAGEELSYDAETGKYKNTSQIASLKETFVNNGAHNLLNTALGARTTNGITFTRNDDGSIVANGTATANAWNILDDYVELAAGTYTLSGCPTGGGSNKYLLYAEGPTGISDGIYDYGTTGRNRTFTQSSKFRIRMGILIMAGQTVSNLTFYPMLRLASDTDTAYEPYAKTNQQLTKDDIGLAENEFVNGAVNLLPSTNTTQVINGITFTVDSDGTIKASGTATADANIYINPTRIPVDASKRYRLSGCPSNGSNTSYRVLVGVYNGNTWLRNYYDTGNGVEFDVTGGDSIVVTIYVYNGYAISSSITFKPMITLADMPNSDYAHYVPYAKSNKELTDATVKIATFNSTTNAGGNVVLTTDLNKKIIGAVVFDDANGTSYLNSVYRVSNYYGLHITNTAGQTVPSSTTVNGEYYYI